MQRIYGLCGDSCYQMFCLPMFAEQKWGKGLKITSLVSSKALEAGGRQTLSSWFFCLLLKLVGCGQGFAYVSGDGISLEPGFGVNQSWSVHMGGCSLHGFQGIGPHPLPLAHTRKLPVHWIWAKVEAHSATLWRSYSGWRCVFRAPPIVAPGTEGASPALGPNWTLVWAQCQHPHHSLLREHWPLWACIQPTHSELYF